jgi:hypothetical protein
MTRIIVIASDQRERGNPALDCFVANAPRNDKGRKT